MKIRPLYLLIVLLIVIASAGVYSRLDFAFEKNAYIMGTPVRVKVFGAGSLYMADRALLEMKDLDAVLSRFQPSSEVGLINRLAGLAPLQVSRETFEVINLAARMFKLTRGTFDITLGHADDLVINSKLRKIYLKKKGVKIDLGGIGKGYAVETARRLLLKKGVKSGMIDMRSSIAVFGPRIWKVGVQHPRQKDKLIGVVELRDGQSLSTSGDYERGKHIIDPRTGKAAEGCQAVTIIGADAAEADALSTAVFVLGPVSGMKLIESLPGIEGLIVDSEGKLIKSSGFIWKYDYSGS